MNHDRIIIRTRGRHNRRSGQVSILGVIVMVAVGLAVGMALFGMIVDNQSTKRVFSMFPEYPFVRPFAEHIWGPLEYPPATPDELNAR